MNINENTIRGVVQDIEETRKDNLRDEIKSEILQEQERDALKAEILAEMKRQQ